MAQVIIIGGGLAGCEAAWQLAEGGVSVLLYEMRPNRMTEAHKSDRLAELVCSNSFRGADLTNAVGLLKEEMRRVGSLIMLAGQEARVPAGGAFAVDRVIFSEVVTKTISEHKNIEVVRDEVKSLEEILRRFTPQDDGEILRFAPVCLSILFSRHPEAKPKDLSSMKQGDSSPSAQNDAYYSDRLAQNDGVAQDDEEILRFAQNDGVAQDDGEILRFAQNDGVAQNNEEIPDAASQLGMTVFGSCHGANEKILIIATGPLTSESLAAVIKRLTGEESLFFYDAISPVVYAESIDMGKCFRQSRYDKGGVEGDYLNLSMSRDEYLNFVGELLKGEKVELKDFEKGKYFEGCLPIEVMAERGVDTLRFGPMKPVGLVDPVSGERPYAVVQLRQENRYGTLYNMVGFQTKLKFGEQVRIFKMIPGLENVEFARLGSLHRNTFVNTPRVLDQFLRLRSNSNIFFAGQMTGVEGYVESAACGLLVGRWALDKCRGILPTLPPRESALGSLIRYITQADPKTFQPMNINFGLFPPIEGNVKGKDRKILMAERALNALNTFVGAKNGKRTFSI